MAPLARAGPRAPGQRGGVLGLRLGVLLFYAAGAGACLAIARRLAPWPVALLTAIAWVILTRHPHFVLAGGYLEEYVSVCGLLACWAALRAGETRRGGRGVGASLALTGAVSFKQGGIAVAVPVLILLSWSAWNGVRLAVLPVLATGVLVGFYIWHGAHGDLIGALVTHPADTYLLGRPVGGMVEHFLWRFYAELGGGWRAPLFPAFGALVLVVGGRVFSLVGFWRLRAALVLWPLLEMGAVAVQEVGYDAPHYFVTLF